MWQRPLEESFTVVQYDQRGAGRSFRLTDPERAPRHVRELRDQVRAQSDGDQPFDIKISGSDDPELINGLEGAGATWWSRWLDPADPARIRRLIAAGPPRPPRS